MRIIRSSLWNLKTFPSFELHSRISLITSTSSKCQPVPLPRIGSPSSICGPRALTSRSAHDGQLDRTGSAPAGRLGGPSPCARLKRDGLDDPPFRPRDPHQASNSRPKVFSLIQTIRQLRTTRSFAVISLNVLGMDVASLTSMAAPSGERLTTVQRVLNPI